MKEEDIQGRRALWMTLLSRSTVSNLRSGLGDWAVRPTQYLRKPQTGLMMMQARAGGTGERFNFGEITVTRCTLRRVNCDPSDVYTGVGHVLGRSHDHVMLAALADALLQDPNLTKSLTINLLKPIAQDLENIRFIRTSMAQSSKVDFFTVAREAGSDFSHEESEI